MHFKLYNTLSRRLENLTPLESGTVRMYLCGPTVYDRAHIGNARPVIVFDVLRRVLEREYKVIYVRNITDIDDKIINAAQERHISIQELTQKTIKAYHADMAELGNLPPTLEPKATEHVTEMLTMIKKLIDKGHAYAAEGHVLFDTASHESYGALSRQPLEDMISGARIEVAPYKRNPTDFVLWKPSSDDQPGWDSPYGRGRPGWHIECSAMCEKHLGVTFDIHGGGQDLLFPHHENEVAQSTCIHGQGTFAKHWIHNGMLLVEGKKMSKSLGNFFTVQDLLAKANGETIRFAMLKTHYRQPLDWQKDTLNQAKAGLDRLYQAVGEVELDREIDPDMSVLEALSDDLNTPLAISSLFDLAKKIQKSSHFREKHALQRTLKMSASILGLLEKSSDLWFKEGLQNLDVQAIERLIFERAEAKKNKDYRRADEIRAELLNKGITLEDTAAGTKWRKT